MLVDGRWDLVAGNLGIGLLTELIDPELLVPPVNVLRVSLHPKGLAPHVVDLQDYAAHMIGRLRRQAERAASTGLRALLTELVGYACDAGLDPVAAPRDRIVLPLVVRHPDQELRMFSTISVLGAPLDVTLDELAIESFFPDDEVTAKYLQERFSP